MSEILLNKILTEITGVKHDVGELKEELQEFKQETRKEFISVKSEINGLKKDTSGLKQEVSGLKQEVTGLKREQVITNERLSTIESTQNVIYNQTAKLTEYHDETIAYLKNLASKDDVDYFDKKIGEHDREIYKIKNNR